MARSFIILTAIKEANNADNEESRRQAQFIRRNVFNARADDFVVYYRLTEELIQGLEVDLCPYVKDSSRGIPRRVKILSALSFLAHGTYQRVVGQQSTTCMSQTSVSRSLNEFLDAITQPSVVKKHIRFPQILEERNILKTRFNDKFKMPDCIGCIDGTYVAMIRPTDNEERYFCRKGYHARNIQLVTDADLNFLHADASYGGASHDNFVFQNSELREHLEGLAQSETTYLLGDSGYAQRAYLMTPVADAEERTPDAYYNKLHGTARNSVERAIGLLKGRFRCLLVHRVLHYNPDTVGKIVIACCVLHNICNRAGLPAPVIGGRGNDTDTLYNPDGPPDDPLRIGRNARSALISRLWVSR